MEPGAVGAHPFHLPIQPRHYEGRVTVHAAEERAAGADGRQGAIDVRALASALQRELRGEVRFDDGSRAAYSTDASNYRQVPIGVVLPRDVDDVIKTVALCREHGAPITSRGGGTSLAGQTCNVAVVIDYSKYMDRVLEIDPARAHRARAARLQPRRAPAAGGAARADLRPRSRDAQPQHAGRDDRQQLVRRALGDGGSLRPRTADAAPGAVARRAHLRRRAVHGGKDAGRRARRDHRRAAAAAPRSTRGCARCAIATAPRCAPRYPRIPRRVSGYNLDALLDENGFDVAQALVGTEGTCVVVLEATLTLIDATAGAHAGRARLSRRRDRRRPRGRRSWSTGRSASRASTTSSSSSCRKRACTRTTCRCCPRAAAGCWSSSAPTPRPTPTRRRNE